MNQKFNFDKYIKERNNTDHIKLLFIRKNSYKTTNVILNNNYVNEINNFEYKFKIKNNNIYLKDNKLKNINKFHFINKNFNKSNNNHVFNENYNLNNKKNNNNNYKNKILENKKMLKNNSQNNIHKKEIILSPNNNQYISFLKEKILNLENKNKQLQKQLNTLNLSIISNEKTYFPFLYEINNFSKTNIQPIKLLNSEEKILELRNIIKDYEKKIYFLEIINQNKLGNYENNKKIFNNIDFNNFKDKINELYDDKNYLINKINDQNFIINTLFKQVNLYENIQQNLLELKQNFGNLNKSIFYEKIENIENIFKDDKYKNIIKNYMNNNNNENNNDNYNDINNDEKQIKKITNISIHYNNI